MTDIFEPLNWSDTLLDTPASADDAADTALRRVLSRLGEYSAQAVASLNMRPRSAMLLRHHPERVEVRISGLTNSVLLVISPEGDLASEVFVLRALAASNLSIPRLIGYDISRNELPFAYAIEGYIGGMRFERLRDGAMQHMVARQVGRALRRAHRVTAPGFGQPSQSGRWPVQDWTTALSTWLRADALWDELANVHDAPLAATLRAATLDHPSMACAAPHVLHGAVSPLRVIATAAEQAQLEALIWPGSLVGGDPLFDLAHAMLPSHPEAFRRGVFEGYTALGPLDSAQEQRLRRLWLLLATAEALRGMDHAARAGLPSFIHAELADLPPFA